MAVVSLVADTLLRYPLYLLLAALLGIVRPHSFLTLPPGPLGPRALPAVVCRSFVNQTCLPLPLPSPRRTVTLA